MLLPLSTGTLLVTVYDYFFSLLLFVLCVFIDIHAVIGICVYCNYMYAHFSPQESMAGAQ